MSSDLSGLGVVGREETSNFLVDWKSQTPKKSKGGNANLSRVMLREMVTEVRSLGEVQVGVVCLGVKLFSDLSRLGVFGEFRSQTLMKSERRKVTSRGLCW